MMKSIRNLIEVIRDRLKSYQRSTAVDLVQNLADHCHHYLMTSLSILGLIIPP